MKTFYKKSILIAIFALLSSFGFAKDYFGAYFLGAQYTTENILNSNKDLRINLGIPLPMSEISVGSYYVLTGGFDLIEPLGTASEPHPYWGMGVQFSATTLPDFITLAPLLSYGYDWNNFFLEGSLGAIAIFSQNNQFFTVPSIRLGYNFK